MEITEIKETYKTIFEAYGNPSLDVHIQKFRELDRFLPYSSTFFCVTNTQDLSFKYISKNLFACLGIDPKTLETKGMRYFWSRIHPEDIDKWLQALNTLMEFTLEKVDELDRNRMSYCWNYRFKHANGRYVNIIQNTTPLEFDSQMKPIIGLAHYTVIHSKIVMPVTATAKYLNKNNAYETIYYSNFSQKLLEGGLTNRERDIVRLLVLDYSSKKIAEKLNISPNTVDTHRRNILKKLNISSTGELVALMKMNVNWI